MSTVQPYTTSPSSLATTGSDPLPVSRYSPTGRALSRLQSQHLVRAATVHSEGIITEEKVATITSIGRSAESEVTMLTQLEQQLSQAVPLAAFRLEALGQLTTLGVAEVVADAVARVRRL